MYELIFDPEAIDYLEKLEKKDAKRIWNKLQAAKEYPLRFFERLSDRIDYKLRVGDYRVIVDIDIKQKKIEVRLIGHRRNIYDRN